MNELLKWLWQKFKHHPFSAIILLVIIIFAFLAVVALFNDIGFGEEVKQYRFHILFTILCLSAIAAIGWLLIVTVLANNQLQQRLDECGDNNETLRQQIFQADEVTTHMQQAILNFLKEVTEGRICEVKTVQFYDGKLYLRLVNGDDLELENDSELRVFDMENGEVIGVFEIIDIQPNEFQARDIYVSPLWRGHVSQVGRVESTIPPNTVSVLF